MNDEIREFKGEFRFLSNFYNAEVVYEGMVYPSSEHAYMAAKTTDLTERTYIANLVNPAEAKKYGRKVKLRDGWETMKEHVMEIILRDKFTRNPTLRKKLLATGDCQLTEGNWWGDKIWGVCLKTNQGKNLLGITLMRIRSELKEVVDDSPTLFRRLIIAGGRDFKNEDLMRDCLQQMVDGGYMDEQTELVCGMAKGADLLGYKLFKEQGMTIHKFIPDWEGLGKRAGFVRNAEMGEFCDGALIFWDGASHGTKHMIDFMERSGKPYTVVEY